MNTIKSESQFYALLIGINYYEPNPYYSSLMGAVRDIQLVEEYLNKTLQIPLEQIKKLISNEERFNLESIRGNSKQEILPTYKNIIDAFNEITQSIKLNPSTRPSNPLLKPFSLSTLSMECIYMQDYW